MTLDRGIIMTALAALVSGCAPMYGLYSSEVARELSEHPPTATAALSETDIAPLPEPVQRYLRYAGHLGREIPLNAEVEWAESAIRLGPDRPWMKLTTRQFNSVSEPMRAAYMRGRIAGVVPMEGRDLYQDGKGRMLIRVARLFIVGDDAGREMDQSALVTILAEALFVPGYALQPYITWEPVDERTARATIRHRDTAAAGVFHFDADGAFTRFETEDRYQGTGEGAQRVRWSVDVLDYADRDGMRIPGQVRGTWHPEEGDFEYWRGRIAAVRFNVGGTTNGGR